MKNILQDTASLKLFSLTKGPQYSAEEYEKFSKNKHKTSSLYFPQANMEQSVPSRNTREEHRSPLYTATLPPGNSFREERYSPSKLLDYNL